MEHSTKGHPSFLNGQHSEQGWWYYFIYAFMIKTPIPTIIFTIISIVLFTKLRTKNIIDEFIIIIPILLINIVFFFNHINIGLRHILLMYPFLFIFVSKITKRKQFFWKGIIAALSIWYILSALFIFPHYLAYFNEFVEGPDNGHNYLIDSNIDWGQDLKGLKQWIDKNNIGKINLAYFGNDNETYRKINYQQLQCAPTKGIIAISVNLLQGIEKDQIKCSQWLKEFKPIEKIGYSIFIYNITLEEKDIEQTEQRIKQDFILLQNYMKDNNIDQISFGTTNKGITYKELNIKQLECKKTNGFVAIFANSLLEIDAEKSQCYSWLNNLEPVEKIGDSIFLYFVE